MSGALIVLQTAGMIAGPIAVAAWARARWRSPWRLFGVGAAAWIGAQLVHIPLLFLIGRALGRLPLPLYCAALGLLAGLGEETARWLAYRFWAREARTFDDGVMTGLGHGGIESMFFGALVALSALGSLGVTADAPQAVQLAAHAALEAPALLRALAVFERVTAITAHVALSLLVLRAVRERRPALLALAIGLHALLDFAAAWVFLAAGGIAAEVVGLAMAALAVAFIAREHARDRRVRPPASPVVLPDGVPVAARGLTKAFGDRTVVDGLDLDIARGEVFALLGPNGAGKTTTVRLLCALIGPTSGAARVAGHSVVDAPDAVHAKVGIATETPGLYEPLSALANLDFYGRLHGLSAAVRAERIERLLRSFDLWERRDEAVSGFSKGMKQKVANARALLHDPEVLFLDEPTSGLDPLAAREVLDAVKELRKTGHTIVLTTHRLDEAEELATRVGIFRTKMLATGTFAELRGRLYGRQVAVRVVAPSEPLREAARGVDGVTDARWEGDRLLVAHGDPDAATPVLVRALVAAGADIRGVSEVEHSLEEVYRDLIGGAS